MVRRRRIPPRASGLTVVEIMIALAISLLGLSASLSVILTLVRGAEFSRRLTEATTLVQSRLEETVAQGATPGSPPSGTTVEPGLDGLGRPAADGPYTRATTWSLTPDGLRRQVSVTVTWVDAQGAPHGVTAHREHIP
jgi:Tfp pilus assembly protein PilV